METIKSAAVDHQHTDTASNVHYRLVSIPPAGFQESFIILGVIFTVMDIPSD
jgi:hypothetical protein